MRRGMKLQKRTNKSQEHVFFLHLKTPSSNLLLPTMTSASEPSPPQFRYTHQPSKVLHLRNLPWECTQEELVELCRPFGKIVNTKCNVGIKHNQAFVEFADLNQAISIVSYYASASEPAQIRGKTVYLQYSDRHEIVNNKALGDTAGNVLLVTIEGVQAGDVSIDVLHLVFSAFGSVHKIATFEKTAGFQALVQYSDVATASAARSALDGRSIPRYLLAENIGPVHLRISFSAHIDLSVKFQSHRSRDYTNPHLPVAPSAIDGGQFTVGPDGKRREPESNVLLASIENMEYAVTVDVLRTVFSAFGTVQKIAIFEKTAGFQALVQYQDVATAVLAKEALEGHCIFEGGYCKLHLSYSRHTDLNVKVNSDRSRDYTSPGVPVQSTILAQAPTVFSNSANEMVQTIPARSISSVNDCFVSGLQSGACHQDLQGWEYAAGKPTSNAHMGPDLAFSHGVSSVYMCPPAASGVSSQAGIMPAFQVGQTGGPFPAASGFSSGMTPMGAPAPGASYFNSLVSSHFFPSHGNVPPSQMLAPGGMFAMPRPPYDL